MDVLNVTTHLPDKSLWEISDKHLNIIQLANKYGYVIEQHSNLQTSDGYFLEMYRLPHGKLIQNNAKEKENKKCVLFIMHGLLSSSQDYFNNGPNDSLAFLAAEKGYDVWFGNSRGNTYSTKHVKFNRDKDKEFWDFSWHEIGIYDLPCMIDYVLKKTGSKTIKYIGHSQGATILTVLLSEKPVYNEKVQCAVFLSPAIFLTNPNKMCELFSHNMNIAWPLIRLVNLNVRSSRHHFPLSWCLNKYAVKIVPKQIYLWALNIVFGKSTLIKLKKLPTILASVPGICSTKQLLHFSQGILSKSFLKYDHGRQDNMIKYGQQTPPPYDLSNVKIPTFIHTGMTDTLISYEDCLLFKTKLPNVVGFHIVPTKDFNHIDFLWADDVVHLLYEHVFANLDEYKNI